MATVVLVVFFALLGLAASDKPSKRQSVVRPHGAGHGTERNSTHASLVETGGAFDAQLCVQVLDIRTHGVTLDYSKTEMKDRTTTLTATLKTKGLEFVRIGPEGKWWNSGRRPCNLLSFKEVKVPRPYEYGVTIPENINYVATEDHVFIKTYTTSNGERAEIFIEGTKDTDMDGGDQATREN